MIGSERQLKRIICFYISFFPYVIELSENFHRVIHSFIVSIYQSILFIKSKGLSKMNKKRKNGKSRFVFYTILIILSILTGNQHVAEKNHLIWDIKCYGMSTTIPQCLTGVGCKDEHLNEGRSFEQENVNILDCFFSRISLYSKDGGVIYLSGNNYYSLNITYSMFFNCACSQRGGAIFFSTKSFCHLKFICANKCSCGTNYHFALLSSSTNSNGEHLSISLCSQGPSGYSSICFNKGNQRIENINSSMNDAIRISGMHVYQPSSFISSFCTFSNNKASEYACLYLYFVIGSISYTNIVHNYSPTQGSIKIYGGSPKFLYCVFDMNRDNLFYVESSVPEITHCFIFHPGQTSTGFNNSLTKKSTYHLLFYNSQYCNTDVLSTTLGSDITIFGRPKSSLIWMYLSFSSLVL